VEKPRAITYSECLSVALVIQQAKHMRRVVLTSADCTIFFHIISQKARFTKKKGEVLKNNMSVLIFSAAVV
jgi:phosphopantetheinyl transferase